jgi:succinyl-CoA synthetase alpha subunit
VQGQHEEADPLAGALISGGADTADAKLEIMEACGFTVTRNPSEMAKLLKALL